MKYKVLVLGNEAMTQQVQKALLALSRAQIRKVQLAAYSGNQIDKTGIGSQSLE